MNSSVEEIREFLTGEGKILVVSHFFPDGDAIGSLLAFGSMLHQLDADFILAIDDACPEKYSFLPGFAKIRNLREQPLEIEFPKVVVLDAGALARIGSARRCIGKGTKILNIDHHFTGEMYGDLNLVDPNASATAEILYNLCIELDLEIDINIAYGLYVGILTDTGRFRFANSSARAMKICSEFLSKGVDPGWVTENLYFNLPFELIQALARALFTIELHYGGLVCIIRLEHGHYIEDSEWFVGYASSIKGVALAAFICEMDPGVYKVSLRSRCSIAVSDVARKFGGGGHLKAAGFRYRGDKDRLVPSLLSELGVLIEEHNLRPGEFFVEPASGATMGSHADWELTETETGGQQL